MTDTKTPEQLLGQILSNNEDSLFSKVSVASGLASNFVLESLYSEIYSLESLSDQEDVGDLMESVKETYRMKLEDAQKSILNEMLEEYVIVKYKRKTAKI